MAIRRDRSWLALAKAPRPPGRHERTFRLPATARGFAVSVSRDGLPSVFTGEVLKLNLEYSIDDGATWSLIAGCGVGGGLAPTAESRVEIALQDTLHFKDVDPEDGQLKDFYEVWSQELPPNTLIRLTSDYLIPLDCECRVHFEEGPRQLVKRFKLHHSAAFDAASSALADFVTSLNWSHTCSGTNRFLGVGVAYGAGGGRDLTTCTYNSISLTDIGRAANGNLWAHQRYLVAPATGSNTIALGFSNNVDVVAGGVSATDVDQSTAIGTQATTTGTTAEPSLSVSSASGDLVWDVCCFFSGTATADGSQDTRWYSTVTTNAKGGSSTESAVGSSTAMDWVTSDSSAWAYAGIAIKAAAEGGGAGTADAGTEVSPALPGRPLTAIPSRIMTGHSA